MPERIHGSELPDSISNLAYPEDAELSLDMTAVGLVLMVGSQFQNGPVHAMFGIGLVVSLSLTSTIYERVIDRTQ